MKPLSELKHLLPENPPGTPEGHYWTMNNMGTCEDFLDELTQAFVDYSKDKVVLDVGCGYGTHGFLAAKAGARNVLLIDKEYSNFDVINQRIDGEEKIAFTPICFVNYDFYNREGEIESKAEFSRINEKIDAILLNKFLHVLSHTDVMKAIINAHDLLRTGGKLFIKCISPFSKIFSTDFHNTAEEYESLSDSSSVPLMMPTIFKEKVPGVISIFTTKSLEKLLKMTGFKIETCKYLPAHIESMRGEFGKDYVMAIARK